MRKLSFYYSIIAISFLLVSCNVLRTAAFDQYSYQKATEVKVESSQLMDKAVFPYEEHEDEVEALLSDLDKIIEYEQNKPYNDISLQMWKILSDEEKNLLGGFLKRWKENGQMSEVFVNEAKPQILEAIDLIIQYEARKNHDSKNQLMNLINGY